MHIAAGFDISAGYNRRSRDLDGYSLVNDLYGQTTTFSGFDPKDVTAILESRTRMERVEDIFDVTVTDVRIVKVQSKPKRRGYTRGRRPGFKKAIVELRPEDRIELFEGV